jgi:YVTN family beta-propeller protein
VGHGGADGGGGIAVDTATGNMLITNSIDNTVTILGPTDRVIATIPIGLDPFGATADPVRHRFHIALRNGNNVVSLNDSFRDNFTGYLPLVRR